MKKKSIVTLMLVLVLMLSMSMTAFAENSKSSSGGGGGGAPAANGENGEKYYYHFTLGANTTWAKGSGTGLTFTIKLENNEALAFKSFLGIKVDGVDVPKTSYSAYEGSVVITLKPEYLETLAVGKHSLSAQFTNYNTPTAYFTITDKAGNANALAGQNVIAPAAGASGKSPKTGVAEAWVLLAGLAGVTGVGAAKASRRK